MPFTDVPWKNLNSAIAAQPGFIDKTWLSGVGNHSVGGLYGFASVEDALQYCAEFFSTLARDFSVAQTSRVFDARVTEDASRSLKSPYYL